MANQQLSLPVFDERVQERRKLAQPLEAHALTASFEPVARRVLRRGEELRLLPHVRFIAAIYQAFGARLAVDAVFPKSGAERELLRAKREESDAPSERKPLFLDDNSRPLRDMHGYVDPVIANLNRHWPTNEFLALGHVGEGTLHFTVAPDAGLEDFTALHVMREEAVDRPLARFEDAVPAECGIALAKKSRRPVSRSPTAIDPMRLSRRMLDPRILLTLRKVVDAVASAATGATP